MSTSAVIVAGADANYFPYLRELALSLDACGALARWDFAVIDAGLSAEQRDWLTRFGACRIVDPAWPFPELGAQPQWTKVSYWRPFLPELFPDWEVLVYFDADSWLQDIACLEVAIAAARDEGFAVVPLLERAHWPPLGKVSVFASMEWHRQRLERFYGPETAQQLQLYPLIVSGFFAGRRDALHWQAWRQAMAQGLERDKDFTIDQASLTLAIYRSGLSTAWLPHDSHWLSHMGMPGLDTRRDCYVEPQPPHRPLASIALAAHSKHEPILVKTTDQRILARSLRYSARGIPFAVDVVIDGVKHVFDGIAKAGFRERLFAALSADGPVGFVQIGAMDGVSFDPIHRAIARFGWHGVLVEPLPDMMARLRANYAAMPGLTFVQAAIAEQSGRRTLQRVRPDANVPAWAHGLASLLPERNALGGRRISAEQHQAIRTQMETVEVECLSFADFASQHAIGNFDVLVIDTEGYDYRILRQVELARHQVRCVLMEIGNLPTDEISASIEAFHAAGFVCYAMEGGEDLLAVNRAFLVRHFGQ